MWVGFRVRVIWVHIPALPPISLKMGKSLNLPELGFLICKVRNNDIHLMGVTMRTTDGVGHLLQWSLIGTGCSVSNSYV